MRLKLLLSICILFTLNGCITSHKSQKQDKLAEERHTLEIQHREFFDAESARLLGDQRKAIWLYKRFVDNYPQNATAFYILARLQFINREITQAERNGKRACELAPSNVHFHEFYTQVLLYQNKLKEAEEQYSWLLKNNPGNPDYLYSRAMLALRNKHTTKALELLNEYELLTGNNEDINIQRKNIYIRDGKFSEAIKEIRKLQQVDPHNVEYPLMLADVYDEMKMKDSVRKVYQWIEQDYKDEPLALVALAQYYLQEKNKTKYNGCLRSVILNPNLGTEAKMALLMPVIKNVDPEPSLADKDGIIAMIKEQYDRSKNEKDFVMLYADMLYATQQNDEALNVYKEYLGLDENHVNAFLQVMSMSFDKGQFDTVISYANRGIKRHRNNPYPYFYKGIAYSQLHQTDSCILFLEKTMQHAHKEEVLKAQVLSSLGDAWNTKKDYGKSDSCFDAALKLTPDDAGVLNNYAYYLSVRNLKLDKAEKMSKRSLELQPDTKSFLDTYGWILYQQQKYADAKMYLEKAEQAQGETDATIYEHIGDVFFKLNDQNKALYYWKKAKGKSESPEEIDKKINGLKLND